MAPVRDLTPGADGAEPGADEIRDRHPEGRAWRADALAGSRHRNLLDEIPPPQDDFDLGRARALCAEICREVLQDFAPGLVLLPPAERRRLQALAAYARTLFDFARQRGLEGERLAQINRWEFTLESALDGQAVGQPVFVAMAHCERERAWPRDALDDLASAARRSVTFDERRPWSSADDHQLARALLAALRGAGTASMTDVAAVAAALGQGRSEADPSREPSPVADPSSLPSQGGRVEGSRVEEAPPGQERAAAREYARFLRFAELTSEALARQARARGAISAGEARLGVWTRLVLLLRARLGGRG